MRLLLDEDVPLPLLRLMQTLLRGHEVEHVSTVGWRGKKDRPLYRDAAERHFDAILTNGISQFNDPAECRAIQRRASSHHLRAGRRPRWSSPRLSGDLRSDQANRRRAGQGTRSTDRPHTRHRTQPSPLWYHQPGNRSAKPLLAVVSRCEMRAGLDVAIRGL
jgi:hypothetical protein